MWVGSRLNGTEEQEEGKMSRGNSLKAALSRSASSSSRGDRSLPQMCFVLSAQILGLLQCSGPVLLSGPRKPRAWLLPTPHAVPSQIPSTQETSQDAHACPQRLKIPKARAYVMSLEVLLHYYWSCDSCTCTEHPTVPGTGTDRGNTTEAPRPSD